VNDALRARIARDLTREVDPAVSAFAGHLAAQQGALAVLFYGSNLRTGELDGVLDYYVLTAGPAERGVWPLVSYHEWTFAGIQLRAKLATMTLVRFGQAASGELLDTTIWARFVQPSALVWCKDSAARDAIVAALCDASKVAARLAVALGPTRGSEPAYWNAVFEATYRAEFRIEKSSRARSILDLNPAHFDGLLAPALQSAGVALAQENGQMRPLMPPAERRAVRRWWARRRRAGKPLNLLRLVRAASTFDGAARYAAWKIERHSGHAVELTPWRERHPVLAAPGVLFALWRARRRRAGQEPM
jgi:hypothetical protein